MYNTADLIRALDTNREHNGTVLSDEAFETLDELYMQLKGQEDRSEIKRIYSMMLDVYAESDMAADKAAAGLNYYARLADTIQIVDPDDWMLQLLGGEYIVTDDDRRKQEEMVAAKKVPEKDELEKKLLARLAEVIPEIASAAVEEKAEGFSEGLRKSMIKEIVESDEFKEGVESLKAQIHEAVEEADEDELKELFKISKSKDAFKENIVAPGMNETEADKRLRKAFENLDKHPSPVADKPKHTGSRLASFFKRKPEKKAKQEKQEDEELTLNDVFGKMMGSLALARGAKTKVVQAAEEAAKEVAVQRNVNMAIIEQTIDEKMAAVRPVIALKVIKERCPNFSEDVQKQMAEEYASTNEMDVKVMGWHDDVMENLAGLTDNELEALKKLFDNIEMLAEAIYQYDRSQPSCFADMLKLLALPVGPTEMVKQHGTMPQSKTEDNVIPLATARVQQAATAAKTAGESSVDFSIDKFLDKAQKDAPMAATPASQQATVPQGMVRADGPIMPKKADPSKPPEPVAKPKYNTFPNATPAQKWGELNKRVTFMKGAHKGDKAFSEDDVASMLDNVLSKWLKDQMKAAKTRCNVSSPHFKEVPLDKYDGPADKATVAFETPCKKKDTMLVLWMNLTQVLNKDGVPMTWMCVTINDAVTGKEIKDEKSDSHEHQHHHGAVPVTTPAPATT